MPDLETKNGLDPLARGAFGKQSGDEIDPLAQGAFGSESTKRSEPDLIGPEFKAEILGRLGLNASEAAITQENREQAESIIRKHMAFGDENFKPDDEQLAGFIGLLRERGVKEAETFGASSVESRFKSIFGEKATKREVDDAARLIEARGFLQHWITALRENPQEMFNKMPAVFQERDLAQLPALFAAGRDREAYEIISRELSVKNPDEARMLLERVKVAEDAAGRSPESVAMGVLGGFAQSATPGINLFSDDINEDIQIGLEALSKEGFSGKLVAQGVQIGGALIPFGLFRAGLIRGAKKAGMTGARADAFATQMTMGLYGYAEGGEEGFEKGFAFGSIAPPLARLVRTRLAGLPARVQGAGSEAIGFYTAGQVIHGGDGSVDAALGAMMGFVGGPGLTAKDRAGDLRALKEKSVLARRRARREGRDPEQLAIEEGAAAEATSLRSRLGAGAKRKESLDELGVSSRVRRKIREQEEAGETPPPAALEQPTRLFTPGDAPGVIKSTLKAPRSAPRARTPNEPAPPDPKTGVVRQEIIPPARSKPTVTEQDSALLDEAVAKYGPKAKKSSGKIGAGLGGASGDLVLGATDVPRDALMLVPAVPNAAWRRVVVPGVKRAATKMVQSADRFTRPLSGKVPLVEKARESIKLGYDYYSRNRAFHGHMEQMIREKDVIRLNIDRGFKERRWVKDPVTGKRRTPTSVEREGGWEFLTGKRTRQEIESRGVPKEYLDSIERDARLIDEMHDLQFKEGLISKDSWSHFKESGRYTRTEYAEFLTNQVLSEGPGGVRIPENFLRRDAHIVTWTQDGRRQFKRFTEKEHGSAEQARAAARTFRLELTKSRREEVEGIKATAPRGSRGAMPSIRNIKQLEPVERPDQIRDPDFVAARTMMLQSHRLNTHKALKSLSQDPLLSKPMPSDGIVPEGHLRVPDKPQYGGMRGRVVPKDVHAEIVGSFGREGIAHHFAIQMIERLTSWWKLGKTVYNPATHFRNFGGNIVFGELAGISYMRPGDWATGFVPAAKVLSAKRGTPEFAMLEAMTRGGIGLNRGITRDMAVLMDTVVKMQPRNAHVGMREVMRLSSEGRLADAAKALGVKGWRALQSADNVAKGLYELEDVWYKVAFAMKRVGKGDPVSEAVRQTNRYFPNYGQNVVASMISKNKGLTGVLARNFFAPPFLSFTAETMRIMGIHAMERPFSMAMGLGSMWGLGMAAARHHGLSMDDVSRLQEIAPDWSVPGTSMTPLWFGTSGDDDKLAMWDARWWWPGGELMVGLSGLYNGRGLTGTYGGLINNPIFAPVADAMRNQNRLTGREIATNQMSDEMKTEAIRDYILGSWLPSLAPPVPGVTRGGRSYQRFMEGVTGEPIRNSRDVVNPYGDRRTFMAGFLDAFVGLRLREINPSREQGRAVRTVMREVSGRRSGVRERIRSSGVPAEEALKKIEDMRNGVGKAVLNDDLKEVDRLLREIDALIEKAKGIAKPLSPALTAFDRK